MGNHLSNPMNRNYKRPTQTFTDKLTANDIAAYLEDYQEVANIDELKLGTHVRYFITENNKKKFRLGGYVINIQPDYLVLSNKRNNTYGNDNNKSKWSVQRKNCILYKQMSVQEIRDEYESLIQKYKTKVDQLTHALQDKNEEIERLTKQTKRSAKHK